MAYAIKLASRMRDDAGHDADIAVTGLLSLYHKSLLITFCFFHSPRHIGLRFAMFRLPEGFDVF